jgi:glutaredoxin
LRREAPETPAAASLAAEPVPTVEPPTDTVPTTDTPRVARPSAGVALAPSTPSTEPRIAAPSTSSGLAPIRASASAARPPVPPSTEQVQTALQSVPIVMFSTSWCPTCARARSFLQANGIRYTERDIDHDEAALEELKRRSGNTLIPTFDIDGTMLRSGFDSNAIASTLAASVERRLGVKGISVRPVGR